jgi:hypothetical protein
VLRSVFHELVVDSDIAEGAAESARGRADCRAGQGHQEDHADQCAPERPGQCAGRSRIEKLIEFDMAIGLLDRNDCVAQFDQVLLLHVEQLLANLLGLFLGWKGDFYKISHMFTPWRLNGGDEYRSACAPTENEPS